MTISTLVLLTAALAVRPDGAVLRTGCEAQDDAIARLPASTAVEIRFAMSGESETCYKVSAMVDGKPVQGYLAAGAIAGLETFEAERVKAPSVSISSLSSETKAAVASGPAGHPLVQASKLIESKQPREALEMAERSMREYGRDRNSLLMAGIAAYQLDDVSKALQYLREAQQFRQDALIGEWIQKIEKEAGSDKSAEKLYGTRFLLRYEGGRLSSEVARTMIATLEQEFSRISLELGCRTDDRIVTVVQSRSSYFATTGAAEWSGGQYDGKIRVPIAENATVTPEIQRAFAHEIVHACLAQMGDYPAWLHEGLAQRLSGDVLPQQAEAFLKQAAREKKLPSLEQMSRGWSRASVANASLAYAYSLLAVNLFMDHYRSYGIQNVLRNPERLPAIAAELDKLILQ